MTINGFFHKSLQKNNKTTTVYCSRNINSEYMCVLAYRYHYHYESAIKQT